MPLNFFASRPQLRGVSEGDHAALCTSQPEVQHLLAQAVAGICRAAPDLGGFFSITASENLTNCWSHGGGAGCPRCGSRPPAEVIAEVNRLFWEGIQEAGTSAQLIAWDWGWDDAWAGDAIRRLPRGVALMSVSEWKLPLERGGVKTEVGEYLDFRHRPRPASPPTLETRPGEGAEDPSQDPSRQYVGTLRRARHSGGGECRPPPGESAPRSGGWFHARLDPGRLPVLQPRGGIRGPVLRLRRRSHAARGGAALRRDPGAGGGGGVAPVQRGLS